MLVGLQTRLGRSLSAYEVFNKPQLDTVISNVPGRRPPISPQHEWHILVELADTTDEVQLNNELQAALSGGLEAGIVSDAALAMNRTHRAAWWEFRHSVTEGNKRAGMGLTTDSAVAVSYIPEFIAEAMKAVRQELEDISINVVAHFGDGNVHIVPVVPFDKWKTFPNPSEFALRIKHVINQVAVRLGGTFSAEHGIGQALVGDMNAFKSPVELDLMRTVKRSLDPGNIFNPGRMLPQVEPTTPEIKTIQLL
jgi:FAD/FMN-containing dehydrogenase